MMNQFDDIDHLVQKVKETKLIIGVNGIKGSGKTTIVTCIQANIQSHSTIIPFAKPVKEFASALGWNGIKDDAGRKILQLLGTDIGRNLIHKNIWVYKWLQSCLSSDSPIILVDDVRFDNEASLISDVGGLLVRVTRENNDESYGIIGHESEQGISVRVDYDILNNGTLSGLNFRLNDLVKSIDAKYSRMELS